MISNPPSNLWRREQFTFPKCIFKLCLQDVHKKNISKRWSDSGNINNRNVIAAPSFPVVTWYPIKQFSNKRNSLNMVSSILYTWYLELSVDKVYIGLFQKKCSCLEHPTLLSYTPVFTTALRFFRTREKITRYCVNCLFNSGNIVNYQLRLRQTFPTEPLIVGNYYIEIISECISAHTTFRISRKWEPQPVKLCSSVFTQLISRGKTIVTWAAKLIRVQCFMKSQLLKCSVQDSIQVTKAVWKYDINKLIILQYKS